MNILKQLVFFVFLSYASLTQLSAQCNTTVLSTNGYAVNISLNPINIIAPNTCPNGYNFDVEVDYDITFSGANPPAALWTLQGELACGSFTGMALPLPNNGGTGTNTTNANPYNPALDCATATPSSLMCNSIDLLVQGPGIPTQTVTCNVVVPIVLSYFAVSHMEENVLLQWATEKEINNEFFTIESSRDARTWEKVEDIKGGGDSDSRLSYRYIDIKPRNGVSYYRLKQTDYNGKFTYSPIRKIDIEKGGLEVYPIPAKDFIYIQGSSQEVSLVSSNGEVIKQVKVSNSQIDVSELPDGLYFIVSETNVSKFIKASK